MADKAKIKLPFTGVKFADLELEELPTSPTEQYSHQAGKVNRSLRCKWKYRWDAAAYLLGWATPTYNNAKKFTHISRVLPDVYRPTIQLIKVPRFHRPIKDDWGNILDAGGMQIDETTKPWLWATGVSEMQGDGPVSKTILPNGQSFSSYPYAKLEVTYEVLHYRLLDDDELIEKGFTRWVDGKKYPDEFYASRFCSFHPQPNVLHMSIPQDGLKWEAGAVGGIAGKRALSEAQRKKFNIDIQIRWYGVPGIPDNIRSLLGTVNDRTWEIHPPGHVRKFSPQNLIYLGFRLHTYRQVTGEYVHDISLLFSHFNEGHNKELCYPIGNEYRWTGVQSSAYDRSTDNYINSSLYPEVNYNSLFQLPNY